MVANLLTLTEVEERVKNQRNQIRREISQILQGLQPNILSEIDHQVTSEGKLRNQNIEPVLYDYTLSPKLQEQYDQSECVGEWSAEDWQEISCEEDHPLGTWQEDGDFAPMFQKGIYHRRYAIVNKETEEIFEINVAHVFEDPTIEYMGFAMHVNCLFLTHYYVSVTYYRERKLTQTKYGHCINLYDSVKHYFSSNFVRLKIARERTCSLEPLTDNILQLLKEDGFFDAEGFPKEDLENTPYEMERYEETIPFDNHFVVYQLIGNQRSIVGYLNADCIFPKKPTVEITKVYSDPTVHFLICTIKKYQSYLISSPALVTYLSLQ